MDVEPADVNAGTGSGMIAFLDYVIRKNEMVESTAAALRTGCRKVLEVDAGWQDLDLRSLDVEGLLGRFRNKYRAELRERSLYNYEMRFRQTVEMYLKWLDDDPSWRPNARSPRASNGTPARAHESGRSRQPESRPEAPDTSQPEAAPAVAAAAEGVSMVAYPLPIRPGVQGRLLLPEDLSRKEAQRVANFVNALAFDERPDLASEPADEDK